MGDELKLLTAKADVSGAVQSTGSDEENVAFQRRPPPSPCPTSQQSVTDAVALRPGCQSGSAAQASERVEQMLCGALVRRSDPGASVQPSMDDDALTVNSCCAALVAPLPPTEPPRSTRWPEPGSTHACKPWADPDSRRAQSVAAAREPATSGNARGDRANFAGVARQ